MQRYQQCYNIVHFVIFADFDYLRDLDRAEVNRKSMDGMVYCIWNQKRKEYLILNYKPKTQIDIFN